MVKLDCCHLPSHLAWNAFENTTGYSDIVHHHAMCVRSTRSVCFFSLLTHSAHSLILLSVDKYLYFFVCLYDEMCLHCVRICVLSAFFISRLLLLRVCDTHAIIGQAKQHDFFFCWSNNRIENPSRKNPQNHTLNDKCKSDDYEWTSNDFVLRNALTLTQTPL